MKIAGKKTKSRGNGNFTLNKNVIIAVIAVLVVVALVVALIVLLPSKKDESDKSTTTKSNAPITGISVDQVSKTEYLLEEEFDPTSVVVKAQREDGTSTLIDGNDPELKFWGFDSSAVSDSVTVYVDYKNFRTSFTVSVVVNLSDEVVGTVTGISVVYQPNSFYYVDDTFSPYGIVIEVTVSESVVPFVINGTHPELEFTGFDSSEPNDNLEVKINFRGVSTSMYLSVKDKSYAEYVILGLTVVNKPKTEYMVNQAFDPTGIKIQVNTDKQDTTFFVDDLSQLTFSGFDSSAPADSQIITVTYEGVSTVFTVTIKAFEPAVPKPTLESIELVDFIDEYTVARWNLNGPNVYGAYFKLHYSDGSVVGSKDETPLLGKYIKPIQSATAPGTIEIEIVYEGITIKVPVEIK